jgi:hypothetical protein
MAFKEIRFENVSQFELIVSVNEALGIITVSAVPQQCS